MFSCEFCEISKITFFIEHLRVLLLPGSVALVYWFFFFFFARFKLTLKVTTKPITVYSKIPLSKNWYYVETRTDLYMIQVFTERYFATGSLTQWVFRCSKSTAFKINNKNTSTTSLFSTFNISTILFYCFCCWLWAGKYPLGIRPQLFPKLAVNLVEQPQWYCSGAFRVHLKTT